MQVDVNEYMRPSQPSLIQNLVSEPPFHRKNAKDNAYTRECTAVVKGMRSMRVMFDDLVHFNT